MELAVAEVCSERGDNGNSGDVVDSGDSPDSSASPARDASRNSLKKDISLSNNNPAPKDAATPVEKISTDQTPADQAPIADQTSVDQSSAEQAVTLDQILHEWDRVLRESTKHNHSVRALLKSTKPIGVEGNSLILEAQFAFHKDRLEFAKNREIVETVLLEIFSVPLTITCCLNATKQVARKKARETGNLTDLNVVAPEVSEMAQAALDSSLLEVFDGGLPL